MIAAALLFLQVASAAPVGPPPPPAKPAAPDSAAASSAVVVRNATRSVHVPVTEGAGGALVRIEALAPIVPVTVSRALSGEYVVNASGVSFELEPGIPAVRIAGDVYALTGSPEVRDDRLYVPLAFVSDVLPRFVPNLRWDDAARQLVAFSNVSTTAPRRASRQADAAPPRVRPAAATTAPARARRPSAGSDRRLIVVDAGHGGPDNGMHGPLGGATKLYEKDITLAVAKRLGAALQQRGVGVVYTRTTDTLIALSDRGAIANRAGGDLFISIHVNAANPNWRDPGGARGFETYFLSEARTEDARRVEQMENDAVRYESAPAADRDDPLSFILSDMMQNEHLRESSELADVIQHRLATIHPGPSRGVKQAGFRVLVTAYMPAVLVEIGFGTNPQEAAFLMSPAKQQEIAEAIADAAIEYLQGYERRAGGTW